MKKRNLWITFWYNPITNPTHPIVKMDTNTHIDFDSIAEIVKDVKTNTYDEKNRSIHILTQSYRLELIALDGWIQMPKKPLFERLYMDMTNIIDVSDSKGLRIIDIESYFIIRINVLQKNYKPLKMWLINLEKELMEEY